MKLNVQDTFNKELPADPIEENTRRQVEGAAFSYVTPRTPSEPKIIHTSDDMLSKLCISKEDSQSDFFKNIFSGAEVYPDTNPYSMCYAGHQFGNWAGQLGDGRAINLMEVVENNKRWALQLKGAGETPYSRTADGMAVLRSSIREHLCSEAMYHLGVPTTRSLSLALTGDEVMRDVLYNGNPALEKSAVVCRVAPSFIRFGNYQIFMARKDKTNLKKLVDYTLKHFYPHIEGNNKEAYIQFYQEVTDRTLDMIIHWQRVGFVHGVMNTDNMSILGLTIDYGPYGWLEGYDTGWTPNTTDASMKRYRFGQQPSIALWNLVQLGNALYPLIEETDAMEEVLDSFNKNFAKKYHFMMLDKIGLATHKESDSKLILSLTKNLQAIETDMTIFFRNLAKVKKEKNEAEAIEEINDAFYSPSDFQGEVKENWHEWFKDYLDRLGTETNSDEARKIIMNAVNPKYVLRNYMAQLAIDEANQGDYQLIDELYQLLKKPYNEQKENEKWFAKRPDWARYKVGCSMLSCSS